MDDSIAKIIDNALSGLENQWSAWMPMPPPENRGIIKGPETFGVYQVRNKASKDLILFGNAGECQERMKSLYSGNGRKNKSKVKHVLENWKALEYRTMETNCKEEAEAVEGLLKAKKNHLFNT